MLTVSLRKFLICSMAECVDNNSIEMYMPTWCVVFVNSKRRLYKLWVSSLLLLNKETNVKFTAFQIAHIPSVLKNLFLMQYSSIFKYSDQIIYSIALSVWIHVWCSIVYLKLCSFYIIKLISIIVKKKEFVQGMFNSGTDNKDINVWGFILSCRVWKQAVVRQ